jgi:hypothetical protein
VITNVEDRVVQRAAVLILQPLLDPLFDARSFGYRPRVGHFHALATAEVSSIGEQRRFWLVEDVQDAFRNIPVQRLLQVVKKFLPADDLVDFLGRIVRGKNLPGLRQGGSLSPLMFNLYLHHALDRPWRQKYPQLPLLRYADDLLVLCRSEAEARDAHGYLDGLLRPAGLPLGKGLDRAVQKLNPKVAVPWLGFDVRRGRKRLRFSIGAEAWDGLALKLDALHAKPDTPLRAIETVVGWLAARGPCYDPRDRDRVVPRVESLARERAFDEIPGRRELRRCWEQSGRRWDDLRRDEATGRRSLVEG